MGVPQHVHSIRQYSLDPQIESPQLTVGVASPGAPLDGVVAVAPVSLADLAGGAVGLSLVPPQPAAAAETKIQMRAARAMFVPLLSPRRPTRSLATCRCAPGPAAGSADNGIS
jgi:hypothetical protein